MIEQERLATIGMLSASIAHEIKNPLTVLRSTYGSVYDIARRLLAEQTDLSESPLHEELQESDEAFRRGFERIGSVLQTMTGHARPFENESLVNVDLHQIITDTLQLTRSVYRGVATVEQRFGTIPTVFCMPGAISQVFLNILLNAVQAIESKGHDGDFSRYGKIVIETAVGGSADEKKMVQCRILNNGPEIPSEVAAKIFEPFFTTKSADVGSGLGLSISRRIIVDRHNGRLEVIQRDGI